MSTARPPIAIVGGGPVGLTVANLLAARDVPVVLVERNASTSDEAKAISLDDESLRTLEAADLAEAVLATVVPGTGTRYYDRHGRPLFHARGPRQNRLGYPFKNQFAQPELERVLLDALKSRPQAHVRFATELVEVLDHGDTIEVGLRPAGSEGPSREFLPAAWVLGCDGGRSTVRELCGIAMNGVSHNDLWLVVDTIEDPHDERYGMHRGTPERPTVIVPGRDGRCRYEFRLYDGEAVKGDQPSFELVSKLIAPYRPLAREQVERCVTYTFNAVVAVSWRKGRCLLLGDAAHMMPPFAGQGLNSGIRDAANLAWKIGEVWHRRATDDLLDTYEAERAPNAKAMVGFSQQLGAVVMTTSRLRAFIRDLAVRATLATRPGRRYLAEMRFRPAARHSAGLVFGNHPLTGTQLPQPCVLVAPRLHLRPLDEVLGDGLSILGIDVSDAWWRLIDAEPWDNAAWLRGRIDVRLGDRLPRPAEGRQAVADADGRLQEALGSAQGQFVLVKPDRYIAAVFGPKDIRTAAEAMRKFLGQPRVEGTQP
ncbi:FAD-dependent monooxygenase [Dactylosporangium sp. NPDC049525]|uniref:FAD-dependent monooxygenase n=1 Tax=Dactylosporangium sp. NPDC049525 TaxID=3154730 RepID=UPI00343C72A6